jgi:hypothetical protein
LALLTNITGAIKLKRMSWVGHLASTGMKTKAHRVSVGKPEGNRHRRQDLKQYGIEMGEHDKDTSGSVRGGYFLDQFCN